MNETLTNRPHSGARLIGDDLQYLIAWYWAIALLKPNDIVRVEIEAADAANLDDVVIRRTSSPDTYCQIKASVDATRPLTLAWLTDPSRSRGPSILQRFFTFSSKNTAAHLRLVTNKSLDPSDPLLSQRDTNGYLADALRRQTRGRALKTATQSVLDHLETDEETLLRFLDRLRIDTDASIASWRERVADCALPSVLADTASLLAGVGWIRTQVGRTRPILDDERVREAIDSLGLWAEPATATVAISALNEVPADDALIHVDLRRYFDPSKPIEGSARWSAVVSHLETTAQQCVALGHTNIMVRGSCRLPLWFVAGHSLLDTKGFDVCTVAHNRTWSSVLQPSLTSSNTIKSDKLVEASGGDSAAIAVSVVADDPTPEIIDYLTENSYSGSLFRIRRAEPSTLISAEQGQALALAIRNEARALCRHLRPSKLHLFLACPAPVALLLGRLWDRLPQTTTYEYLGSGTGYEPAVVLQSS